MFSRNQRVIENYSTEIGPKTHHIYASHQQSICVSILILFFILLTFAPIPSAEKLMKERGSMMPE